MSFTPLPNATLHVKGFHEPTTEAESRAIIFTTRQTPHPCVTLINHLYYTTLLLKLTHKIEMRNVPTLPCSRVHSRTILSRKSTISTERIVRERPMRLRADFYRRPIKSHCVPATPHQHDDSHASTLAPSPGALRRPLLPQANPDYCLQVFECQAGARRCSYDRLGSAKHSREHCTAPPSAAPRSAAPRSAAADCNASAARAVSRYAPAADVERCLRPTRQRESAPELGRTAHPNARDQRHAQRRRNRACHAPRVLQESQQDSRLL